VIPSEVQVLTNVGLEHTRWLGPTVIDIAREKLAVVQDGGTLVVGSALHPDAEREARAAADQHAARLLHAEEPSADVPLPSYQRRNFALAGPPPRRGWASSTRTRSSPRRPASACLDGSRPSASGR